MDQDTRNRLRNVVTACRRMLEESVEQVLQGQFDIYATGKSDAVHADEKADLKSLSVEDRAYRADIIAHLRHIEALGYTGKTALKQLVREIAFTHLNRLCAYKMMAAREVWVGGQRFRDVVGKGMQSQGFDFYLAKHDADKRLSDEGHRDLAYRHYLNWVGGLLSEEIGVLFSPNDPANRLYPPQRVLDAVLAELNGDDLKGVWDQDETIGWVYQYFTPKELRDEVRKESQAPRNSYELAFRNQFFTPRYVVEFLTDNTLGRIWYEMRQGRTRLAERCCYLVRRPDEVFLSQMTVPEDDGPHAGCVEAARLLREGDETAFPAFDASEGSVQRMIEMAHTVSAYDRHPNEPFPLWSSDEGARYAANPGELSTQFILDGLFMTCRADRHGGNGEVYTQDWFIKLANEVRRRALAARNPELKAEELLKLPVFVPFRAQKDPRELRVLDPACGSGHFLLYCFDLLLTIYEEAYETDAKLKEEYATIDDLRRDVPRLILAHNLHGIDIDPRAAQIAALALWLRCHRRYREMGLKEDRPKILRSNIVCAEPMPGERQMLKEFVNQELGNSGEGKLLGQLVEVVFDKMKLAGEAGSLLKIEDEIRKEVAEAKRQFNMGGLSAQPSIPGWGDDAEPASRRYAVRKLQGNEFFEQAEGRVVESLKTYAEKAHNDNQMQRRLFADDAVRGFAFVEMCHRRFDVVLMNPPFGESVASTKSLIAQQYPGGKPDVYAAFVEMGTSRLSNGKLGVLSSRTGFFLPTLERWRHEQLLGTVRLNAVADLGLGVLDEALVEAAAYVVSSDLSVLPVFISALDAADKEARLLDSITKRQYVVRSTDSLLKLPLSVISYWVTPAVARLFDEHECLEGKWGAARVGLQTSDDFRFLRLSWEVAHSSIGRSATWVPMAKGGEYQLFWDDIHLLVNWKNDAEEMKAYAKAHEERTGWARGNSPLREFEFYFKGGVTYPERTTSEFSPRLLPDGCITGTVGPGVHQENIDTRFYLLGWLTTRLVRQLIEVNIGLGDAVESGSAARHYNVRMVGRLPVPNLSDDVIARIAKAASHITLLQVSALRSDETSRHFVAPFESALPSLQEQAQAMQKDDDDRLLAILEKHWQMECDFFREMDLPSVVEDDLSTTIGTHPWSITSEPNASDDEIRTALVQPIEQLVDHVGQQLGYTRQITKRSYFADRRIELIALWSRVHPAKIISLRRSGKLTEPLALEQLAKRVISWAVGCVVGRWDIRRAAPYPPLEKIELCSAVPQSALGTLQNESSSSSAGAPLGYPLHIDSDGIVPDDLDNAEDIIRRVREVLELIWAARSGDVEKEACDLLGLKELRDYFRKPGKGGFWDDHVSRYSKSRRKAPIYWLLQSSKKNYGLWVYYHRLDKDTLFKAVQPGGPVSTKINLEQTKLGTLRTQKADLGAAKGVKKLDKDIEKQELFVAELQDFEEKLRRAANLDFGKDLDSSVVYEPDLNDGVVLNIAPLWELVPWKEAKNYWDELLAGEYEWSSMGKLLRKKGIV